MAPLPPPAIHRERGAPRRFSSSRKAIRHSGLDVTVYESDDKRAPGKLSRQGPPVLRWALYEAATSAARPTSPDHSYYLEVKARCGGARARVPIPPKPLRRPPPPLPHRGGPAPVDGGLGCPSGG